MSRGENNKSKFNKYLTPMIAGGVFLIFVVISLLLAKQDIRRFFIILLLLSIIGLCAYFIYSIRKAERVENSIEEPEEEESLRQRLPLRAELFQQSQPKDEVLQFDMPSELYEHRAEVGVNDNLFGLEDEPMVFDTNRARRTEGASIIRREDPSEDDFEDYQLELEDMENEYVGGFVSETVPANTTPEEEADTPVARYERKVIERPAFRGFTRTLDHSPETNQNIEHVNQHRTTFEPARENNLFQGFEKIVEEDYQNPATVARETSYSSAKPFRIPSLDDEPQGVKAAAEEVPAEKAEEKTPNNGFKIPEVGTDKSYRSNYNNSQLFKGTGVSAPSRSSKPAETGLFGGSGYKSPFDK